MFIILGASERSTGTARQWPAYIITTKSCWSPDQQVKNVVLPALQDCY